MRTTIALALLAVTALSGLNLAQAQSPQTFGPVTIPVTENPSNTLRELADFIWTSWTSRQAASFQVTTYTKEGEAITRSGLMQADQNGRWQMTVHVYRQHARIGMPSTNETQTFVAYGLESSKKDGVRQLTFKDASGQVMERW